MQVTVVKHAAFAESTEVNCLSDARPLRYFFGKYMKIALEYFPATQEVHVLSVFIFQESSFEGLGVNKLPARTVYLFAEMPSFVTPLH